MSRSKLISAIPVVLALGFLVMPGETAKAGQEGMTSFTDRDLLRTGRALSNASTLLAPLRDPDKNVTVYITDFGINQYKGKGGVLKMGDDFTHAQSKLFPDFPKSGQILIVMPPHGQFKDKKAEENLSKEIFQSLKTKVDQGIAKGTNNFEVQMVQHIGTTTYFTPSHQDAVNRFGRCAYKALGMLNEYLKEKRVYTTFHAIVGSNGTKILTENIDSWKTYLKTVTLFDGRAFKTPTIETIKAIGPQNVRIFNTAGDFPAEKTPAASIGNHEVVKNLKKEFPQMTCGWLDPLDRLDFAGQGHLAGMNPNARLSVKYFDGKSYSTPAEITGKALQPKPPPGQDSTGVRQYWVDQSSSGLITVSNTMASMAGKANPQRALLVGDHKEAIQSMVRGLPPGTQVKVIPYTDAAKIQQEANSFGANVILGVRNSEAIRSNPNSSPNPPFAGPKIGSPPPSLTYNLPPVPTFPYPMRPSFSPPAGGYSPPPPPYNPPRTYTSPPAYNPQPRYTPPPMYAPSPRFSPAPGPIYTPPPRMYTPMPSNRR